MRSNGLDPEDYMEPRCVLCDEPYGVVKDVKPIPQQRVIQKMDEYMSRRDYDGAERHLLYWLEEARLGHDLKGELMVRNELIGHYRKTGNKEASLENADRAIALLKELDFEESLSAGTTYVNAATACNAFGENERSIALFEKARQIYEGSKRTQPALLGSLYNNMALTLTAIGRYEEAYALYDRALQKMGSVPAGRLEQAITCLNKAHTLEAEKGMEESEKEIYGLLDRAAELLSEDGGADPGYYAFVLEKCAPGFSYYGYFLKAQELEEKSKRIYERA